MEYLYCQYCNKECKNLNSLRQHEIRCKQNPNKINLDYLSNRDYTNFNWNPSNQFIKAKQEGKKYKVSEETKNKLKKSWLGKKHTKEEIEKISNGMKIAVRKYPESYSASNVCGRVKHYDYKGFKIDGLWELEVAKYLDSKNIKWIKPMNGFEYKWNNDIHIYYPDFYLPEYDYYIEVKGYQREQDIYKWQSVPNLIIIKNKEIKAIRENSYVLGL